MIDEKITVVYGYRTIRPFMAVEIDIGTPPTLAERLMDIGRDVGLSALWLAGAVAVSMLLGPTFGFFAGLVAGLNIVGIWMYGRT